MKPTQEQVIAWAREAGAVIGVKSLMNCDGDSIVFVPEELQTAFALAYEAGRKDENEVCAKVCESLFDAEDNSCDEAEQCANAIRSRREQ
jgi:formate-dependent phosphoribosylglycinamide formyltransferase (GAR transformylase)